MPTKCTKSNLTFFSSPFYFPTHPFQHTPQNHTKPKSKETKLKSISQTQFTNFKDSNFFFSKIEQKNVGHGSTGAEDSEYS